MKSSARSIADNGARARKALLNLLAHGARSGLFGARAKLLCFRLKFLQNPGAILDQPRDIHDVLSVRRESLVERGLCGFGVNDHPADFFHPRATVRLVSHAGLQFILEKSAFMPVIVGTLPHDVALAALLFE